MYVCACRLEQLEERLQVKIQENNELQLQVQKGREALESATVSKTELQKKAQASQRQASETRRLTAEDLSDLEQVHSIIITIATTFQNVCFLNTT